MNGLNRDLERIRREISARTRARRRIHAVRRERSADDRPAWRIVVTELATFVMLLVASFIWFAAIAAIIRKVVNF